MFIILFYILSIFINAIECQTRCEELKCSESNFAPGTANWCECCNLDCDRLRAACLTEENFCSPTVCADSSFCVAYNDATSQNETVTCAPACQNGGVCKEGTCDCTGTGWEGVACQKPSCPRQTCEPNGYCSKPNTCLCNPYWYGVNCEMQITTTKKPATSIQTTKQGTTAPGASPMPTTIAPAPALFFALKNSSESFKVSLDDGNRLEADIATLEIAPTLYEAGGRKLVVRVGDQGADVGVPNAQRHSSQAISLAIEPANVTLPDGALALCMKTAFPNVDQLCLATYNKQQNQWDCTAAVVYIEDMARCARVPYLERDLSERVFGMLLKSDAGPTMPPTPLPTTTLVNVTRTETQKIQGVLMDADSAIESTWDSFRNLGEVFQITLGVSIGVCVLCCCCLLWYFALSDGGKEKRRKWTESTSEEPKEDPYKAFVADADDNFATKPIVPAEPSTPARPGSNAPVGAAAPAPSKRAPSKKSSRRQAAKVRAAVDSSSSSELSLSYEKIEVVRVETPKVRRSGRRSGRASNSKRQPSKKKSSRRRTPSPSISSSSSSPADSHASSIILSESSDEPQWQTIQVVEHD